MTNFEKYQQNGDVDFEVNLSKTRPKSGKCC